VRIASSRCTSLCSRLDSSAGFFFSSEDKLRFESSCIILYLHTPPDCYLCALLSLCICSYLHISLPSKTSLLTSTKLMLCLHQILHLFTQAMEHPQQLLQKMNKQQMSFVCCNTTHMAIHCNSLPKNKSDASLLHSR
jgi:hypothetical protein